MSTKKNEIEKNENPLRRMIADSHGLKYEALNSLDEARKTNNAYLVMQGDDGGQIYLTAPVGIVKVNEKILEILLKDIDTLAWNDPSMVGMYYEIHEKNTGVAGGMGGGRVENDLWVHKDFESIKDKIKKVITGTTLSLEK